MKDAKGHGSDARGTGTDRSVAAHSAAINNLPPNGDGTPLRASSGLGRFALNAARALGGAAAGVIGTVVSGALRAQSRERGRR